MKPLPVLYRRLLCLFGLAVPFVLLIPIVRAFMEASMLRHMLGVLPLLVLAGGAFSFILPARAHARMEPWNRFGIPGLLLAAVIIGAWMIPLALDRATESIAVDTVKTVSVFIAGFSLFISFPKAQLVTQLFFVWNWVAMTVFIGVLYQSLPTRLCSAYLLNDQDRTGRALVILAAAVGMAWCYYAWGRFQARSVQAKTPVEGSSK